MFLQKETISILSGPITFADFMSRYASLSDHIFSRRSSVQSRLARLQVGHNVFDMQNNLTSRLLRIY